MESIWTDIVLSDLSGAAIAKKYKVSPGHVSQLKKAIGNMKYKPRVENNQVVCLECGKFKDRLVFHHDHSTDAVIGLLCPGCNVAVKNKITFHGVKNEGALICFRDVKDLATNSRQIGFKVRDLDVDSLQVKLVLENLGTVFYLAVFRPNEYNRFIKLPKNKKLVEALTVILRWSGMPDSPEEEE